MQIPFFTLDVFTAAPFAGNPVAVVMDAERLNDEQMQLVARELNLSETVFVTPPETPAQTAIIRIFTPSAEVPFAGHPTIGAAILMAHQRFGDDTEEDAIIVLKENLGAIRVGVRIRPGAAPFAEFDVPQKPERIEQMPDVEDISLTFGLIRAEIGFENHVPTRFDAGLPFLFLPVRDLGVMAKAEPNIAVWRRSLGEDVPAVCLYCRDTQHNDADLHVRMFAPMLGVHEDPATGSAAAALAGPLMLFDQPPGGEHRYQIEQGIEMGRPSRIELELVIDNGLHAVRIGGNAVIVSEGHISI